MPCVSVVIPTYNRCKMLKENIYPVPDQDCGDFELIVVDDGSSDDTPRLPERYEKQLIPIRQENADRCVW